MTVRWKPLLILSGLFLVIAVVSVIAFAYTLVPRNSADILPAARSARTAGQYANAQIHYQRALQKEPRSAAIHEELAGLYEEWAEHEKDENKAEGLRRERYRELENACGYEKKLVEPRRILLRDALARDELGVASKWAKELLELEPKNAECHYALAAAGLETRPFQIPEIRKHLEGLQAASAPKIRVDWVKACLADLADDDSTRDEILNQCRTLTLPAEANALDRLALLRLRVLDIVRGDDGPGTARPSKGAASLNMKLASTDPAELDNRLKALQREVQAVIAMRPLPPARITRLGVLMERVQKALIQLAAVPASDPKVKGAIDALVSSIDANIDSLYLKALDDANKPELALFLTYADHLRYREKRSECLAIVGRALRTPMASLTNLSDTVMGLHAVATESALSALDDKERIEKATPHIKALLSSTSANHQGLGHLFQGAIDLERAGVGANAMQRKTEQTASPEEQQKLRASALNHLEQAARQLPKISEAQARYGVALVLLQDQALGRQYLQSAMRMGTLAPQYQIWAAWSMVQAGYPEEAEPIVVQLMSDVTAGRQPRELEGTLHLLRAEIYQSRRSEKDLTKAIAEYVKATKTGQKNSSAIQLRLAQIDVQLGKPERALLRIEGLRKAGQGLPPVEHLAVLILQEQGKKDEARKVLDAARKKFPENEELVTVDAAFLVKDGKPKEADRALEEFVKAHPAEIGVALMRAQVLADSLNDVAAARTVLLNAAETSVNSGPLVQLAELELKNHDREGMARTIAKIRARWKDAATADVLDAQLAMDQGDLSSAIAYFDAALKKDPGNKLVVYLKAQLDIRTGAAPQGTSALEELVSQGATKELESGTTLMEAAQSALASIELQNRDYNMAIQRLEELRAKSADGTLDRAGRWLLVNAFDAKGDWARAKRELAEVLNDAKEPPSPDERVRGANLFQSREEYPAAFEQVDMVLKKIPDHPGAVVLRAFMLAKTKKPKEASDLLHKAISAAPTKDKIAPALYLTLAAVEYDLPPSETNGKRAVDALDVGLSALPDSPELVQAKYLLLFVTQGAPSAVEYIESKAKGDAKPVFRRMLVDAYKDQKNYAAAEQVVRGLLRDNEKDASIATNLVQLVALQAVQASDRNEREREQSLNEMTANLIKDFRSRFPNDMAFLQADCDLAARRSDFARAIQVTQEMDALSKASPTGPINRARIYAVQSRFRESADALEEALRRNDRMLEVRISLGQTRLRLGETDEAIQQAKLALRTDPSRPDALLLQAQALAQSGGTAEKKAANREEAIKLLNTAITSHPKYAPCYHLLAELLNDAQRTAEAVAALEKGIKAAVPEDTAGLSQLIVLLAGPRAGQAGPSPADLERAKTLAEQATKEDKRGTLTLAVAVGFHRAGQLALALPWAEKAAAKRDAPVVHLTFGDLLLSMAEASRNPEQAQGYFRRAVDEYDRVLKLQANSIEAVNNKAWILHTQLHETDKALELAAGLMMRVDPSILPPEFFDTLGAIQQDKGKTREAEATYQRGLTKAADHPVLNYRMAKLLSTDRSRARQMGDYLKKARDGRARLSPAMASDLDSLASLSIRGN